MEPPARSDHRVLLHEHRGEPGGRCAFDNVRGGAVARVVRCDDADHVLRAVGHTHDRVARVVIVCQDRLAPVSLRIGKGLSQSPIST